MKISCQHKSIESAAEDPPSQCVAVAAPSVVDGGRVAQVVKMETITDSAELR